MASVPTTRIRHVNDRPIRSDRSCVVYWMVASRRASWNFALDRAAEHSTNLGLPLIILEALRCDYPWASERLHRFIIQGMVDNRKALDGTPAVYFPFVEDSRGQGRGLLQTLAEGAAVVVTDDYPTFFLPEMIDAAGSRIDVRLEAVDANGLMPMSAFDREFATAYSFRRAVQKCLVQHIDELPLMEPCLDLPAAIDLPRSITETWPVADLEGLSKPRDGLAGIPIDHSVSAAPVDGGAEAARKAMENFLDDRLEHYGERRNRPDEQGSSGLSPYLHFGHISSHEVFIELMRRQGWSPDDVIPPANGRRAGWWGVSKGAEAFLDQLITWRELGFNVCRHRKDHDSWDSLPDWARLTLEQHARDPRESEYTLDEFAASATHDELWNAAQTQLRREGTIHNYLRMLWGKKILEWTADPRESLEIMFELNNRYALDGRDPNSSTGIMWVLGRHDRPWGPERPIFGKVRYMSSANTRRKMSVTEYIRRYS